MTKNKIKIPLILLSFHLTWMFTQKSFNTDFFLKLSPVEIMGYSCQNVKKLGGSEFIEGIGCSKKHPKTEKLGFVTEYGCSACLCKHFINKSLN